MKNRFLIIFIILFISCEESKKIQPKKQLPPKEDSTWIKYEAPFGVSDLAIDNFNDILAITESGELYKFCDSLFVKVFSLENSCFKSINFDKDNNVLIGTYNQGVLLLNKYYQKIGFSQNPTPKLDKPMPFWRILKYDDNSFLITDYYNTYKYYNYEFELYDTSQIWDFSTDTQNNKLFGYPNGLIVETEGKRKEYKPNPDRTTSQNMIISISLAPLKAMILGNGGLFEFKDNQLLESSMFNKQFNEEAKFKIEYNEKDENFWIGTSNGLIEYYSDSNYKVYNSTNTTCIESNYINKMVVDYNGVVWFYDSNVIVRKKN